MVSRRICRAYDCAGLLTLADSLHRRELEGCINRSLRQLDYLAPRNTPSPRVLRYTVPTLLTYE